MSRLHPGSAKPVIALPLIILMLAIFVVAPCCVLSIDKFYSAFSVNYAVEQAAKAYKENRFDEAALVLERLNITHKLKDDERSLLNDIYLARADAHGTRQNYALALSDLALITPGYSKFLLVNQKKREYLDLSRKPQPALADHSNSLQGRKSSAKTTQRQLQPQPAIVSVTRPQVQPRRDVFDPPVSSPITPTVVSVNADKATVQAPPSISAKAGSTSARQATPALAKKVHYLESDVVRYNELLAAYFSQDRKGIGKPAEAEPPSLKEWVDLGKPSF